MERPNFVFVMTDSQGANVVGCYGRPELGTPCIDRLGSEGVRYARAYTSCPVCTPARAGIFTGTFPHTAGAWTNTVSLSDTTVTMGQRFRDAGYATAYVGKWHLAGHDYFDTGICPDGWDDRYWYDGKRYVSELSDEEIALWRSGLRGPGRAVPAGGLLRRAARTQHLPARVRRAVRRLRVRPRPRRPGLPGGQAEPPSRMGRRRPLPAAVREGSPPPVLRLQQLRRQRDRQGDRRGRPPLPGQHRRPVHQRPRRNALRPRDQHQGPSHVRADDAHPADHSRPAQPGGRDRRRRPHQPRRS